MTKVLFGLNKCSMNAKFKKLKKKVLPTLNKNATSRKLKKKVLPTLKKCSTNASSNKTRTYTTVVRRQTVTTTTITTTTTLSPGDDVDKDVSIYICVLKDLKPTFTWFKIDPNANTNDDIVPVEPLTQMPESTLERFQAVACGSEIYTLGGSDSDYSSSDVFVCDTNVSPLIWKDCSNMELARDFPAAAAVDGCIYALGYSDVVVDDLDPWAEVFHPSSQTWTTLPRPKVDYLSFSNSVFAKQRGDIIIMSLKQGDCVAHAFHCKTRSWTKIPLSGSYIQLASPLARSIVVGDMVYTFVNHMLYGWDLSQSKPCVKQVNGLEEEIKRIPYYGGLVVHLVDIGGGKLCLVWYGISIEPKNLIYMYCLKFWVGTRSGGTELLAIVDRCDKYAANGIKIANCLTI